MPDYQQTVDAIRAVTGAIDQTKSDELVELASVYASLCRDANDRLRRCADYLHRGLRSEAIQLADTPPALLDMVAALDMPELPEWENLCFTYDMPRPPKLLMDAAQELNEAYAEDHPVQALLARHRVLALARAPLAERLRTMRELAPLEAGVAFWDEDIRVFERSRFREVHAEASAAAKGKDVSRLTRLLDELSNSDWREDVPPELRRDVERATLGLRQSSGIEQLRQMLPKLDIAYAAMSHAECAALLQQWSAIVAQQRVSLPQDLQQRVQPIAAWVAEQDRRAQTEQQFKIACFRLSQALDAHPPLEEMQRLHREAAGFEIGLPDELERRYRLAVSSIEMSRKRRMRRNFTLAAAAVLLLAFGAAWLVQRSAHNERVRTWSARIVDPLAKGEPEEAAKLWDEMKRSYPSLTERPELVTLRASLDAGLKAEADRKAGFESQLAALKEAKPETTTREMVDNLSKLARTKDEKLQVLDASEKAQAFWRQQQDNRDAAYREKLGQLAAVLKRIESQLATGTVGGDLDEQIGAADALVLDLSQTKEISATTAANFQAVKLRFETARQRYADQVGEANELKRLVNAADNSSTLAAALAGFASHFPSSTRAPAFARSAQSASAWAAVEEWSKLAKSWSKSMLPTTSRALAERIAAIETYKKTYPKSPLMSVITRYQATLIRAEKALALDGPWQGQLRSTMNSPLVGELAILRTTDNKAYYCLGKGNYTESRMDGRVVGVNLEVLLTSDVRQPARKSFKREQVRGQPVPSPQAALATKVLERIDNLGATDAESFAFEIASLIRNDAETDPVLKTILLNRVFRSARESQTGADVVTDDILARLAVLNAEDVAWMNPDDATANAARQRAARLIADLPDFDKMIAEARNTRDAAVSSAQFTIEATGVLLNEGAKPIIRTRVPPADGFDAFAVGADGRLIRIASVKAGKVEISNDTAASVSEGAMVFFRKSARP